MTNSYIERFWSYVVIDDPDSCWLWKGSKNNKGYGQIKSEYGKNVLAHRVSYAIYHNIQYVERGDVIRHSCDNPACVNPAHLLIGTQQDNVNDMVERGRQCFVGRNSRKGEANGFSHLTSSQVLKLRELYNSGMSIRQACTITNIEYENARIIIRNKSWKEGPWPIRV